MPEVDKEVSGNSAKRVSRRAFIKGVITSGIAVSSASYLFRASTLSGQGPAAGFGERLITLNVNGQQRHVDVVKQETLAWTLRYKLGLTGTKLGCDRAECGSCTVLIDDVPYYACSVLTHTVRDRKVLTIEGLASPNGKLHPVQQGVVDEQGFQCAYYARVRHGCCRIFENQSKAHSVRAGAWHFGEPVPLPGLRQDPHFADARSRVHEEEQPCLKLEKSRQARSANTAPNIR